MAKNKPKPLPPLTNWEPDPYDYDAATHIPVHKLDINTMDKDGLYSLAMRTTGVALDTERPIEQLRQQVVGLMRTHERGRLFR